MTFTVHVSDVEVTIDSILLYTDETILALCIGNGYTIKKTKLEELPIYEKITDGRGQLSFSYLGSALSTPGVHDPITFRPIISLMHLHKEDTFAVEPPLIEKGVHYSGPQLDCHEQLEAYQDKENLYLNSLLSLLHIFKNGNIGLKEVFLEFKYTVMALMNQKRNNCLDNQIVNTVRQKKYLLSPDDVIACNTFIAKHLGINPDGTVRLQSDDSYDFSPEYCMMKDVIGEFVFGIKQTDTATGFEQFTTALEMVLLVKNESAKKEKLSKRVAAMLGSNDTEVAALYNSMKNFYRYRSESLHEGDGRNITEVELDELEEIVRQLLRKYFVICEAEIAANQSNTWSTVKAKKIQDVINIVIGYQTRGVLPA